jgi:hypothetical protein
MLTVLSATSCQFADRFCLSTVCLLFCVPFIASDPTNDDRNNLDKTAGTIWKMLCYLARMILIVLLRGV